MESMEGSILASDDRSSYQDRSFSKPLKKKELNNDPHEVVLNEEYVKNLQNQYEKQVFLLKDLKDVNLSLNHGNTGNF